MEKKKEKEREEGKEGKRMDERKEKKEKYRYTRTYTSVWSAWNRVSFLFRRRVREFLAPRDYERSHFASENFDYSFSKIRRANLNFVEWKWHNGTELLSRAEKGVAINIARILRIGNIAVDKKAISSTSLIQIIIIQIIISGISNFIITLIQIFVKSLLNELKVDIKWYTWEIYSKEDKEDYTSFIKIWSQRNKKTKKSSIQDWEKDSLNRVNSFACQSAQMALHGDLYIMHAVSRLFCSFHDRQSLTILLDKILLFRVTLLSSTARGFSRESERERERWNNEKRKRNEKE